MGASIEPAQILKELSQLWTGLGGEPQDDGLPTRPGAPECDSE